MRALSNTTFIFFFSFLSTAALLPAQKLLWQSAIGGKGYDNGIKMIPVDHNCFLLGGSTASANGLGEGNHSAGKRDLVVARVSAKGKVIWKTLIGGSQNDDFSDMTPTKDGGVLVIGTTESRDGHAESTHGKMDFLLVKLNRSGDIEWNKCYGGHGNDKGLAAIELSDGGYLIGGESGSNTGNMTYHKGGLDAWMARLDEKGNVLAEKSFGGRSNEKVTQLVEIKEGRYLALCTTNSRGGDVKHPMGAKDVWAICVSKNFDIIWQETYGGSDFDEAHSIIRNKDGDFVICGTTFSDDYDLDLTTNHGLGDSWLFMITPNGNLAWSETYGGAKSDGANGVAQTPDGGYILVGTSNSKDKIVPINKGLYDGWIVRTDSNGKQIWAGTLGGEDFEYLYSVHALENGNYMGLGFAESTKGDLAPLNKEIGNDFWFFRFTDPDDDTNNELVSTPYLTGHVLSRNSGLPVNTEIILTDNDELKVMKKSKTERGSGWYEMDLFASGNYSVMYSAPGFMFYGQDLDYGMLAESPEMRLDVFLDPIMVGSKVILNNIYFDTGKYELRDESTPELRRLKHFLTVNPNVKVEISGHTDNTGNLEHKKELSLRRATRVRDWLLKNGIPGSNMQVAGYGMERPIADEDTPEARAKNRRVEVEVVEVR